MSKKEDVKNDKSAEELEKEVNETVDTDSKENDGKENTKSEETPNEPNWESKFSEINDKYLRLYSEFDNYRKRTMKEKADLISSANTNLLKDLLPILDDFERAIASNEKTEDSAGLKEGFLLIYNKVNSILKAKGLQPMESKGEVFDMDKHEAVTNIPVEDETDKGKIVDVLEKGYYLNEKVIRYAKVVVGQ
jgi:molecular chaperone GrpE